MCKQMVQVIIVETIYGLQFCIMLSFLGDLVSGFLKHLRFVAWLLLCMIRVRPMRFENAAMFGTCVLCWQRQAAGPGVQRALQRALGPARRHQ